MGESVVEAPRRALAEVGKTGTEVFLRDRGQQTQWQEAIDKGVMYQSFGGDVRELGIPEVSDFGRVAVEVCQTAHDGGTKFGLQIKAGGMLTFEGNKITLKSQIVAN